MNWGRAIVTIRAAKGVGQVDLGLRSGVSGGMISLIETGHRSPSLDTLTSIAATLNVPFVIMALIAADRADLAGIPARIREILSDLAIQALR